MLFFSDLHQFRLVSDEVQLRDSSTYQDIRSEINRRNVPLSGGTDWDKVRVLCEQIGANEGVDLLVAIYYTVAATKTQGLTGLAVGLELQTALIKKFGSNSAFPAVRRSELFAWMIGKIGPEIRSLKPSVKQLRELYRCERACHSLHNQFNYLQPEQVPDLDMVAFTIFEYIDQLETNAEIAQPKIIEITPRVSLPKRLFPYIVGMSFALSIAIGGDFIIQEIDTPESIVTFETVLPKVISINEIKSLPHKVDFGTFESTKFQISNLYSNQTQALMTKKVTDDIQQALALNSTLLALYPEEKIGESITTWKQEMLAVVDNQYRRFSSARTYAANINLMIEKDRFDQARELSRKMEDYAISLSPVYGRAMYIEELIEKGEIETSKTELNTLLFNLKALNLKVALLENKVTLSYQN
ncbi:MAG: type VI secretion system ImpA family N-terminal domain-containing protein [Marinomonas atlantica]|nr:type VI secretion system ImpA family N-terminal domain-containing protein [Marinomonas atlantica]